MKVLFITNYAFLYGANRSLLAILEYLHSKNYDILVLVPSKGSMTNELDKKNIPYKIVYFYSAFLYLKLIPKHLLLPLMYLLNILVFPYLIYITKTFKPDLVYSNTSAENLGILIAKLCNIKHISHIREFMSLDHGAYFIFGNFVKRAYFQLSNGLVFVSKSVHDYVMMSSDVENNNVIIYNGIKESNYKFNQIPIPKSLRFGIVGVLQESKGHHLCIEYFNKISKEYPTATLNIFGKGYSSYERKLISLISKYNLDDKVFLRGFVENPDSIYDNIDILLMFSRFEGFGRVTVEAMSRGIPVIGFNTGGTTELIEDGRNGFLFDNFDCFEHKLRMLTSSQDFFNTVRLHSFDTARMKFSSNNYTDAVEKFILKICKY